MSSARDVVIRAVGLRAGYRDGDRQLSVLNDISVGLRAGEVTVFMGPSGSGKTTLLSVLGGLLTPNIGRVELGGEDLYGLTPEERSRRRLRSIGFVFQSFRLVTALSCLENVALPLRLQGLPLAAARRQARTVLAGVSLDSKEAALPAMLSGGEKQRVAIARALVHRPRVILADEPTANLDEANGHAVGRLIASAARESELAVGLVTHDTRLAQVADSVLFLEQGCLRESA